jgi:hypothetical protein
MSRCVASRDCHGVGICRRLDPRGDIRSVAKDVDLTAGAFANDHRTGIDADSRGKLRMPGLLVELRYPVDDCEARADRALGIIVMCLGPAEESHHAVAEILGDVAIEAGYRFCGCGPSHRLAPFLRIELRGNRG